MDDDCYRATEEPIKDLKECPECNKKIIQDIFYLPKGEKINGSRLMEARACNECKIIYEIIS